MVNPLTWLSKRRFPYEPLITVEISRSNLIHNLNEFRKVAPHGLVAPVLKSNAYGHGFREVAGILRKERHIPFFVVDSYFEAVALRSAGIRSEILIIGYSRPETILSSRLPNAVFTVTSLETLRALDETEWTLPIHLKIDTGMNRQGIALDEINQAMELIAMNPLIELKGIMSHFSTADHGDASWTESQITLWNRIVRQWKTSFPSIKYAHISATSGHRFTSAIDADTSRLGIGLYGLTLPNDLSKNLSVKPVLSMKSVVTAVKTVRRDQTIGYDNSFRAPRDMRIAIVPAGYFEGIDRRLSNKGWLGVTDQNIPCPIVGMVSMNITTIDVTGVVGVKSGTPVTIISSDPEAQNSITRMADIAGTIPYELAVHIPHHLKRVVID